MIQALRPADDTPERTRPAHDAGELIALESRVCAANYKPVPVVVSHARDVWVWDVEGRRYLDMMSAYSAVSHGHLHPRLVAALQAQAARVAVTSRAYHSDTLGPFLEALCTMAGLDRALPMNTGAEAVETAIKAARRWGHRAMRLAPDTATILVARNNFHGRTTTIVGFSSDPSYRDGFGPFAPGFRHFDFGDMRSLDAAYDEHCCAVLVEPIQGEAGVLLPPDGWLRALRRWCDARGLLLILDEVQSGLGRTGRDFAFQHEGVRPDGLIVGKALGGGLLPVSAFVATSALMDVFEPGSHGSTFGGNALAAAVGLEALRVLKDEQLSERSAALGDHLMRRLQAIDSPLVRAVRGRGLWAAVDIDPARASARTLVERLARLGVLSKETHETVIRIAPPLTISRHDLDWGIDRLLDVLDATGRVAGAGGGAGMGMGAGTGAGMHPASVDAAPVAPTMLLCPPERFEVSYQINPWMKPGAWAAESTRLSADAHRSWASLAALYRQLGARIEIQPPVADLPDLVFTANSAVVLDGKVLLARFAHDERRGEEPHDAECFGRLHQRGLVTSIHRMPKDIAFEGAGDAVWDGHRNLMWFGHGQRSQAAARDMLQQVFDVPVLALELVDPRFYHLDTCLCPLSGGEVLWVPKAFSAASRALLESLVGPALIALDDGDAASLAANAVNFGREFIVGRCSDSLRDRLTALGYRVHRVPLDAFALSGGSAWCLTLRLDLRSRGTRSVPPAAVDVASPAAGLRMDAAERAAPAQH